MTAIQNRIIGYRVIKASELQAHPDNWRKHPAAQEAALRGVLSQVGWVDTALYNVQTGRIIDGHLRKSIAAEDEIPVLDVDLTEDEERLVLATLDPIGAMAEASGETLHHLLQSIHVEDAGLQALLNNLQNEAEKLLPPAPAATDPGADIDHADELREKWQVQPGQLWEMPSLSVPDRAHRLICGDSTDAATIRRLMNGQRAVLFATDPPYLVDYDGNNHPHKWNDPRADKKNKDWSDEYHDWDDSSQGKALYEGFIQVAIAEAITAEAAWYCWHASKRQALLEGIWEQFGAFVHQQIIWVKDRPVLTRSWYMWQHEPCFMGWIKGHKPKRVAEDYPSSIWQLPTLAPGTSSDHPTQKPTEVFAIPMRQHTSYGDLCYEPFSGSGSQLVAGEETRRIVYACELNPAFVAVALERLAGLGLQPCLVEGGAS
ncbi:MAG: adenine methyltransferase [Chloroflexota bacterium]|nr:MAG: adenine methyltransferase [Chloroflexota bacterium]